MTGRERWLAAVLTVLAAALLGVWTAAGYGLAAGAAPDVSAPDPSQVAPAGCGAAR